jgi:hypothetical protein
MLPADTAPPDATLDLAKVVGAALAAGAVDRDELFELAVRVVDGNERLATRLGVAVAGALISALHDLPPLPANSAEQVWQTLTSAPPAGAPAPIGIADIRR